MTTKKVVKVTPPAPLSIDQRRIYRVERRRKGEKIWVFVIHSDDDIHDLLNRYEDTDDLEFRVKVAEFSNGGS